MAAAVTAAEATAADSLQQWAKSHGHTRNICGHAKAVWPFFFEGVGLRQQNGAQIIGYVSRSESHGSW